MRAAEQQGILGILDHGGFELAQGFGLAKARIGNAGNRRLENAEAVFASGEIDALLIRDDDIALRHQGGRHMQKAHAAIGEAGCEAAEIQDHAAAEGDDDARTGDAAIEKFSADFFEIGEAFFGFADGD